MGTTLGLHADAGPTLILIVLVGLAGLAVLLERLYVIVLRSKNNGRAFIERVIQLVRADKIDDAIKTCTSSTAALPDIGLLILRSRSRDEIELQKLADAAALHVLPNLSRRIQYLPTFALTAALLGAFGTMRGIQAAFALATATGQRDAAFWELLANGMTPVELGIAVAVVLTLGRGYLVSQSEFITEQVHEFSARLINALIDRPDVRLGHR
jgi:biopolymer transport protein ExbB/TolQ